MALGDGCWNCGNLARCCNDMGFCDGVDKCSRWVPNENAMVVHSDPSDESDPSSGAPAILGDYYDANLCPQFTDAPSV